VDVGSNPTSDTQELRAPRETERDSNATEPIPLQEGDLDALGFGGLRGFKSLIATCGWHPQLSPEHIGLTRDQVADMV